MKKILSLLLLIQFASFISAKAQRSGHVYNYFAVKTHKDGDSPAMWHKTQKKGTIAIYWIETGDGTETRTTKIIIDKKVYILPKKGYDIWPQVCGTDVYCISFKLNGVDYTYYTEDDGLEE